MVIEICEWVMKGKSLRAFCRQEDKPHLSSVFTWLAADKHFSERYAQAMDIRAEHLAEDIIEISDDSRNDTQVDDEGRTIVNHDHIQRAKLRVDSRKWIASHMAPKKYGDRLSTDVNHSGTIETRQVIVNVPAAIAKARPRK